MTLKENIYKAKQHEISIKTEKEKQKILERLRQDAYYQIEDIRQKFKNIFLDDLDLIDIDTLIKLEDESLYLSVTMREVEKQIENRRK